MSDDGFSLAGAEALFGPENWDRMGREVDAAPEFSQEQRAKYMALLATVRIELPTDPAADAA